MIVKAFFGAIALLVAIRIVYPYIRFIAKRAMLFWRISAICKRKGHRLTVLSRPAILSGMLSPDATMEIETSEALYSVKLIGTPWKHHFYNFIDSTTYAVSNTGINPMAATPILRIVIPPKVIEKKPFDFTKSYCTSPDKKHIPIVLMCPTSSCIYKNYGPCGNGDFIHEGYFHTLSSFSAILKN